MNIQSLSVCVPAKTCINNCKFCCVRIADNDFYKNNLDENLPFYDLYQKDYLKRLEYTRDNGCNTVILTGNAEPQQNRSFLKTFGIINSMMKSPFRNIEIQTTGVLLDESYLRFLRNHVGVTTISLSVSCLDDDKINNDIIQSPKNHQVCLENLCKLIKKYDFNLRLSLNMTRQILSGNETLPDYSIIFNRCVELGADQVTIRKMFYTMDDNEQNKFILSNIIPDCWFDDLAQDIVSNGKYIDTLEYGAKRYSYRQMSVVVDEDCMAKSENKQSLKYLILRPNCKLYSKWDDKASLVF